MERPVVDRAGELRVLVRPAAPLHRAEPDVTHDLDFGRIVALSGRSVPSIVTLRLSDMTPRRVNAAIGTVLVEAAQSLERGALVTITDTGIRVRELPIETD